MGALRKAIAALAVAAFPSGPLGAAPDIFWTFAGCTGRLSALMEHQWLMSDPASDRTKAQRAAMITLLEATTPAEQLRPALSRRIQAKEAQARLLTRATFNDDPDDADWALRRSEAEIAACVGLLLG